MARLLTILSLLPLLLVSALALAAPEVESTALHQRADARARRQCRCFPGDQCWPSNSEWSQFNRTLGGKLIATVPIASACHNDAFGPYNADQCTKLRSVWGFPETHYRTPSSPMAAFFANSSCDPFTSPSAQCVVGSYVQYTVNATSARDYQRALEFVQEHNIRLVIRNTGHDYYGKSTGAGALGIWTHNLKDMKVLDYRSKHYSGKAMKIGAGVQGFEAQKRAHDCGLVIVGGNCPSVGIAGGYTQGGGHGPLVTKFGLGADQVLEWEVVTATGKHLVATPTKNRDLYWALSGGGGGTYGVVLSMTVKAHKDMRIAAANLTFTSQGVSQDTFFSAVNTFLTTLPKIVDAGAVSIWLLTNEVFLMQPTTAPGLSKERLQALMDPTLTKLNQSGMPYS
jgi:hypothetical protein